MSRGRFRMGREVSRDTSRASSLGAAGIAAYPATLRGMRPRYPRWGVRIKEWVRRYCYICREGPGNPRDVSGDVARGSGNRLGDMPP